METKKLWEFPVASTSMASNEAKLIEGNKVLFDYYDEKTGKVFCSGIIFDAVQAVRHKCEKFLTIEDLDAYDHLVEMIDSAWIKQLRTINKEIADYWNIKHYAIMLDSSGLFEFIARNYKIIEPKEGSIKDIVLDELDWYKEFYT